MVAIFGDWQSRRGETHQRAKLTDRDVELIRQLYESGAMGCQKLANKFEISKRQIQRIVRYQQR